MDVNTIMTMIGSVGFPIAMCVALLWFINKTLKEYNIALGEFKDALHKNTSVLETLREYHRGE